MSQDTPTLRSLCLQHLQELKEGTEHLVMAAVSSADGFPIALLGAEPQLGRKATAMAAALDGLSKSIAKEFALGGLEGTVLECDSGLVLCRQVHTPKRNLVLLMVMSKDVTYGHALWAIKNAARAMATSLQASIEVGVAASLTSIKE
ncbi:roadblock/LC7 domain-containing protein [Pseudomonas sp. MM211]|uniref:roadblock/LC7 domain-containing protein n=1 Tax=Pseudomonas sp. MM211 TaxID=2866808 RepID=UPI001CECC7E3|nr:roadblock/LC7 domain-containing protein [Pseudomonas sp. MM211]UCJ17097.1 roadblock/LC7 domain-containing protein [Pseudomonas sp. MM211]